jgi:hypothetical protein
MPRGMLHRYVFVPVLSLRPKARGSNSSIHLDLWGPLSYSYIYFNERYGIRASLPFPPCVD